MAQRITDQIKSDITISLNEIIQNKNYDTFLNFFSDFYNFFVKSTESFENYSECFEFIEPFAKNYGDYLRRQLPPYSKKSKEDSQKICYFFPNIDNDLAHIELFYNMFKEHDGKSELKIFVASFSSVKYKSKYIKELELKKKILIIPIELSNSGLISFLNKFITHNFSQLVVVSVPYILPVLVRALRPNKVTWLSMKFELDCFTELINRISYLSSTGETFNHKNIKWYRNTPALLNHNMQYNGPRNINSIKFITINREEKIRDLEFLESVTQILLNTSNSSFSWTGRIEDPFISDFFKNKGLENRVHFIGWVDPFLLINDFDIFLDVPKLSGYISAQYFAAGFPIVSFKNSNSWIEIFEKEFRNNPTFKSEEFIASNNLEYINLATELAKNINLRQSKSILQKDLGLSFYNTKKMYKSHIEIINSIIQED
jgi:hypothetical protein